MKVALFAAAASLVLAFAAHAAELPLAAPHAAVSCDTGMLHTTSLVVTSDAVGSPQFCPQFLSTQIMKLPRRDQRT